MKLVGLSILSLLAIGLLLGHALVKAFVALRLFASRGIDRIFTLLAISFLGHGIFLIIVLASIAEVPSPRPLSLRVGFLIALIILAISDWPLAFYVIKPPVHQKVAAKMSGELQPEEWDNRIRQIVKEEVAALFEEYLVAKHLPEQ